MSQKNAPNSEAKTSVPTEITGTAPVNAKTPFSRISDSIQKFGLKKSIAIFVAIVLLVGGFFAYNNPNFANIAPSFIAKLLNLAPTVVAGNFSLEYKKIPYNVPSIDITFSRDLDPNTVNANSVRIYPFVAGTATLKTPRTISYALGSKLSIGTTYLLQFTTDIASSQGKHLENEVSYEVEAIGGVAINKMIPDGDTKSLSKNPIFIFNIPVVPLSSLEVRDQLPCPVTFEPAIKGRCTWPSGNILEYRLDGNLDAATNYQVKVALGAEFLFPLENAFTGSFSTTPLRMLQGSFDESGIQRFSPKNGIPLVFTAPVELESLSKALALKNDQGNVILHKIVPSIAGETVSNTFTITAEKGTLPFSTNFSVSIAAGLMPKPGNMPLKETVNFNARSNAFVSRVNFSRTDWSATGGLLNTYDVTGESYIPPVKPLLSIFLDEPIDLAGLGKNAAQAVKLREKKGDKEHICLLTQPQSSVPEFPDSLKMVMKPDQQRLDCQINGTLPFSTEFELVFDTSLTPSLSEPVRMGYETPKPFEIYDIVLQKATEMCIYATANIDYTGSGVTISPQAKLRAIGYNTEVYDYRTNTSTKTCEYRAGQIASVAEVRLNGKTKYDFAFDADLRDYFGSHLKTAFSKKGMTAPALLKQDEYLYFMPEKRQQVIPLDAPVVLPLQTINLDSVNIQVCSLTPDSYAAFLNGQYNNEYTPKCETEVIKKVPLKNGKWNLTTQKIDLAADVLGGELPGNILLVRGSPDSSWHHDWPEQRDFQVVYLRTNLSLMLEQSENKTIVFATDFDGKTIPSDLRFESFRTHAECNGEWAKDIRFNAEKQYYETPNGK